MEQKTKWLESVCEVCGDKFKYQALLRKVRCGGLAVMPRRLCDVCRETSLLESKKKSKRLKHQVKDEGEAKLSGRPSPNGNVTGVIRATHAEIARALRISKSKVEQMEREVLLKIRNHPELKKLWVNFKEEGMPLPRTPGRDRPRVVVVGIPDAGGGLVGGA